MQKPSKLQYKMPGGNVSPLRLKVIKTPKNYIFYYITRGRTPKIFDFSSTLQGSKFYGITFFLITCFILYIFYEISENLALQNPLFSHVFQGLTLQITSKLKFFRGFGQNICFHLIYAMPCFPLYFFCGDHISQIDSNKISI